MIADIQVVPSPTGTGAEEFKHVNAAIAVIASSGLKHTVHALGTTIEGPPDSVWDVARRAFEACLESGADKELMYLKMYQGERTVDELVASGRKFSRLAARSGAPAGAPAARPPAAAARRPAVGSPKRPRGRAPKGKTWDAAQGCWVADEEAEEEEEEEVDVEEEEEAQYEVQRLLDMRVGKRRKR